MTAPQFTIEPGSHELAVTHDVAAPPALVFRTFAEPALLGQWLGPRALTMKVDVHEWRAGGAWRYIHVGPDGDEHAFRGLFHGEPSVESGITQTWEYEGFPGEVSLQKATFEPTSGGTRLRMSSVHQTVAARDAHVAAGMEHGAREGFERMDELVAGLLASGG